MTASDVAERSADGRPASPVRQPRRLGFSDRLMLAARVAVPSVFILLFVIGVVRFDDATLPYFATGMALLAIAGAFSVFAMVVLKQSRKMALREMLVVDIAAAGLMAWGLGSGQNLVLPWAFGLATVYGAALSPLEASSFALCVGIGYGVGEALAPGMPHTYAAIGVIAVQGVSVVVFAMLRGLALVRQDERERHLRKTQREYHDLNRDLSRRLGELRAISDITEIIHSTLDFDQVGQLVLEILSKVIDLPASALFVIDQKRNETLFDASFGVRPLVPEVPGDTWSEEGAGPGSETFACSTVLERNDFIVVFCAAGDRLEGLSAEDRLVLSSVASELVVALENSQLYKLTKRLSITDELTGLYNYRFMQERVQDEIERARRFGRSLSLLMLDVDNFKVFNDTYGHIAGDAALADLASAFREALRDVDVLCRYGGEEFTIVLPETDADGAFVAADKVRETVAGHLFADADGDRHVRMTVSIGLATFPAVAAEREELLRQADNALYRAKRAGRNRVCAPAGPPVGNDPGALAHTEPPDTGEEA